MTTYSAQPDATAGKDTHMRSTSPTTNYGTNVELNVTFANTKGTSIDHAVLEFDLSSIPAGSTVTDCHFDFVSGGTGTAPGTKLMAMHRLTQAAWTEAGATWNTYDGTNNWTAAGGDYAATPKATWTGPSAVNTAYTVGSDANTVALAQDAIDNRSGALRLLVKKDDESTSGQNTFDTIQSSDATTAANRPKITVVYTTGASVTARSFGIVI